MNEEFKNAFVEVIEVLNHSSDSVLQRIPNKLIELLNTNKSATFICKIDFTVANWENDLTSTAQAILAIIYRDFLVSSEERKRLLDNEIKNNLAIEQVAIPQIDGNNLFKPLNTPSTTPESSNANNQLIEIPIDPWYKRIYNKVLSFFK